MVIKMEQRLFIYVGCYAEADASGIYVYEFDEGTGQITRCDMISGLRNPTFLTTDTDRKKLYSIAEITNQAGIRLAEVVSFSMNDLTGKLTQLNRAMSLDAPTCHIQIDKQNQYLIVSSYHGGKIGLVSLRDDGQMGMLLDVQQHYGSGSHPQQHQPHPHAAYFSPDEQHVYVTDLGLDCIKWYTIDKEQHVFVTQGEFTVPPGSGPRHLTFHPNGKFVYVINELSSTISIFHYNSQSGVLSLLDTTSTLPSHYRGENACAEIVLSADGRFLYGSNRGDNSLVIYNIHPTTGFLTVIDYVSTEGNHPRHFALTPSGKHMIIANRDTNNLTIFQVDAKTGKLTYTGCSIPVNKPVCVKPVNKNLNEWVRYPVM